MSDAKNSSAKNSSTKSSNSTHFGFQQVGIEEKVTKVNNVFSSVADNYDLMNDAMSLGIHRLWKRSFVSMASLHPGDKLLDLASGSGDIAIKIAQSCPKYGELAVTDINADMLEQAKKNLLDNGIIDKVKFEIADAQDLQFPDAYFDSAFMSFGLRNVADKQRALNSVYSKLRSGGHFWVLEFSHPTNATLAKVYDSYSFNVIPKLGQWLAKDEASYQYLVESIRMHPTQEELKDMFIKAGFINCHYYDISMGIVAIHKGVKP